MNIWTAFFLVVSVVILASPLLLSRDTFNRNGSDINFGKDEKLVPENGELELDLASGRLARADYEAMTNRREPVIQPVEHSEGNDGSLPEG